MSIEVIYKKKKIYTIYYIDNKGEKYEAEYEQKIGNNKLYIVSFNLDEYCIKNLVIYIPRKWLDEDELKKKIEVKLYYSIDEQKFYYPELEKTIIYS
jgi:hypothetical protein